MTDDTARERIAGERRRISFFFDEVSVGDEVTPLVRGPMTAVHLMRWASAEENWHRIHYDAPFATDHEGLPGILVNGMWKQHFLVQMMRAWLGEQGWLARIGVSFRTMDVVGSTLTAHGRVIETDERRGLGFVVCDIGIRNETGTESTSGTAVGVLPLRGGQDVPYPFPEGLSLTGPRVENGPEVSAGRQLPPAASNDSGELISGS